MQAAPNPGGAAGDQLLLSSSRSEVLLWRADGFDAGGYGCRWPDIGINACVDSRLVGFDAVACMRCPDIGTIAFAVGM
jgi:hypothetical protein